MTSICDGKIDRQTQADRQTDRRTKERTLVFLNPSSATRDESQDHTLSVANTTKNIIR